MTVRGVPLRGDKLKELRNAKGWSQTTAAQQVGASYRAYQGYEVGRRASVETAARIAHVYGITLEELVVEGQMPPDPRRTVEERLDAMNQKLDLVLSLLGEQALEEGGRELAELGPAEEAALAALAAARAGKGRKAQAD